MFLNRTRFGLGTCRFLLHISVWSQSSLSLKTKVAVDVQSNIRAYGRFSEYFRMTREDFHILYRPTGRICPFVVRFPDLAVVVGIRVVSV